MVSKKNVSKSPVSKAKAPGADTSQEAEGAPINLRTLAEHLGLSQATVSLVLNDSPAGKSIPHHTRARVIEAATRLRYRPNYFARSLRRSRSMSVGVLTPDLSEGYFTLLMDGVQQCLLASHYFYFTVCHYYDPELIEKYPRLLLERAVDAVLLLSTQIQTPLPVPIVALSAHYNAPGVTNLVLDHQHAADLALKYLYDLGHRKIAFMRGPSEILDTKYRWDGIVQAARKFGLPIDPELCLQLGVASFSPQIGYDPVKELLSKTRDFTAIFCFNDVSAIGAISAIKDSGLSVPEDISIVGFDDMISAAFQSPKLTTIRQPLQRMGREGAEILLEKIQHPNKQYPSQILIEPELVVRDSATVAPASAVKKRRRAIGPAVSSCK